MKEYNALKNFIFFLIIFYFISGLSTEIFLSNRQKDFPPFFSWFLFDRVPNAQEIRKFSVLILEVNGKKITPPVLFYDAKGIVAEPDSPKARELIKKLGYALQTGAQDLRLQKLLEEAYLPENTKYEIVLVGYDPLLRYKSGNYKIIESFGLHSSSQL